MQYVIIESGEVNDSGVQDVAIHFKVVQELTERPLKNNTKYGGLSCGNHMKYDGNRQST